VNANVVHEHINASQPLPRLGDQSFRLTGLAYVRLNIICAWGPQDAFYFGQLVTRKLGSKDDTGPSFRECPSDPQADPAAAASYQCRLASEHENKDMQTWIGTRHF